MSDRAVAVSAAPSGPGGNGLGGGGLANLLVDARARASLVEEARELESLQLSAANTAWVQMLATGALSPLDRLMGRADYESVRRTMRLAGGDVFPAPLILPVERESPWAEGMRVALRDPANHLLGVLTVEERYTAEGWGAGGEETTAVGGRLEMLPFPEPLVFPRLHRSPAAVRERLAEFDGCRVIAADAWEPADEERTAWLRAAVEEREGCLLLNLPAASERLDDFELYRRLRECERGYRAAFGGRALLNCMPLPRGTRNARRLLLQAIIHRNFGADAWVLPAGEMSRAEEQIPLTEWMREACIEPIAAETLRGPRSVGETEAAWPKAARGFCVWLTGLPGAGKSTLAERLIVQLMERGRRVTLLDGDIVRTHLSRGLSFSREDRDVNVQRIGFVAAEIVRHEGVAICAAVSPYRSARDQVRRMMPADGFIEVFVDTPLEICEQRDVKGFYARARRGKIQSFTGVDDPYEAPESPEVRIRTCEGTPQQGAQQILDYLLRSGRLAGRGE